MTINDKRNWLDKHGDETTGGRNLDNGMQYIVWESRYRRFGIKGFGSTYDDITMDTYDTVKNELYKHCLMIEP